MNSRHLAGVSVHTRLEESERDAFARSAVKAVLYVCPYEMRIKHFLLACLIAAGTLAGQTKPDTPSIEGHVVNALTGAPIRKAAVTLTASEIHLVAETDADGRFQFTGLPAGIYRLSASHPGFLDHAARRPVSLNQNDDITDALIRLPPQGVISGQVLDEDGDPVGGARAFLFRQVYRSAGKRWERLNGSATANETGEYRFPNLAPGRYTVEAYNPNPSIENQYGTHNPEKPTMDYVPTYYPNAQNEQAASSIEVSSGADLRGVNVHLLRLARPPFFHVTGRVTGMPRNSTAAISVGLLGGGQSSEAAPPDYAFDIAVPPGQDTLWANVMAGPEAYAAQNVDVTGNISGLVLAMMPPPDVTATVVLAESDKQINLQGVQVTLMRVDLSDGLDAKSDARGKLVFSKPIVPGHYSITVSTRWLPDGCFVKAVKFGGQEVSADNIAIETSARLDILLSNKAAAITGAVSDEDGKPFGGSTVTLIPSDGKSRPVKLMAGDDGGFRFTGLAPGNYKLFAWEEVDDAVWLDPEFRSKYEDRATEISVGPGETQKAQLRVIPVGK